ncbi:hypothetical protein [Arthrobacter ulcerisalmonis]|uniref:hypothetical protein n=1 Tax=Arthrobacter ulcerisalmonis TaxID=2483813 RepID=UPI00362D0449
MAMRGGRGCALSPHEVALIARDLETVSDGDINAGLIGIYPSGHELESEVVYASAYLERARDFVRAVASDGRGFAYMIG